MTARRRSALFLLGVLGLAGGSCVDRDPAAPDWTTLLPRPAVPAVSNPQALPVSAALAPPLATQGSVSTNVVYVSFPSGTVPDGGLATVRSPSGDPVLVPMALGGFDPVPVVAMTGDAIAIDVQREGGTTEAFVLLVPAMAKPIVVRTNPPRRKRDVPLNTSIVVVFSEPIDAGSIGGIRLLQAGAAVAGGVVLSADGLRAEFRPSAVLAANADYVLSVPTTVLDAGGYPLEHTVDAAFTTGTSLAVASIATVEPALFVVESSAQLRAFSMNAILRDDGRVTGSWEIYYAESDHRVSGRVTCFTIVDNKAAWVAGVIEQAPEPDRVGMERGWRAVDNGPPGSGVADQLSLAHPLEPGTLTAQEFCATQPLIDPDPDAGRSDEIVLRDLISGDIVANPSGPPPPPRPPPPPPPPPAAGMSQIAFARGIIWAMNADGTGLRIVTDGPSDNEPAWSPDGTTLAFHGDRVQPNDWDIYVVNWDGSGLTPLTSGPDNDVEPAWSPDGRRIAFVRNGLLHLMNADGSGVTPLSNSGNDSHPTWGSDTGRVVFASTRSGVNAIYVINTDGSGLVQLTNPLDHDTWPAWSPDGSMIAYQHGTDSMGVIYVMNADGSETRPVALGHRPAWSPDARVLAYDAGGLTVVNLDGSGIRFYGGGRTSPAWTRVGTMPTASAPFRSIEKVSGDRQTGSMRTTLPEPLTVRVLRDDGTPEAGVLIRWGIFSHVDSIPASLSDSVTITDSSGIASTRLTLGGTPNPWIRVALSDGTARKGEVMFTATVVP